MEGRWWEPGEDELLRQNTALPAREVAAMLGRTEAAVNLRRRARGLWYTGPGSRRKAPRAAPEGAAPGGAPAGAAAPEPPPRAARRAAAPPGPGGGPPRGRAPPGPRPASRRWTAAEDSALRRGARSRSSELAARLGRTVPAVEYRRGVLGLRRPPALRMCAVCGAEFAARGPALVCGPECRRDRHRAYMRARPRERAMSAAYLLAMEAIAAGGGAPAAARSARRAR